MNQPIYNVRTMEQIHDESVATEKLNVMLLLIFASVALALALVGIYGVMSYAVTQRTHEIGIRLALGAQRSDVLRLVVGQGMLLTTMGIGLGVVLQIKCRNFSYLLLKSISSASKLQQWLFWRIESCAAKIRKFSRRSEKSVASANDLKNSRRRIVLAHAQGHPLQ